MGSSSSASDLPASPFMGFFGFVVVASQVILEGFGDMSAQETAVLSKSKMEVFVNHWYEEAAQSFVGTQN